MSHFSPATYTPFASSVTNFSNPSSSDKSLNRFAESYSNQLASGAGLVPAGVQVNAYFETDLPRNFLDLRHASQLPIAAKIRATCGASFSDAAGSGLSVQTHSSGKGCVVSAIRAGSAAAEARLQIGDVIYAAHSYLVDDAADYAAVAFKTPGPLEVFFTRPGTEVKMQVVIYRS